MAMALLHVFEREPRFMRGHAYVRGAQRVAPLLREAMAERGVTAKELAQQITAWAARDRANRKPLDYRTVQTATSGSCEFDTYLTLAGFFGWSFAEAVHTPVIGADPIKARETELEGMLAAAAAIHERLERDRAARAGLASAAAPQPGRATVPSLHARSEPRAFDESAQPR